MILYLDVSFVINMGMRINKEAQKAATQYIQRDATKSTQWKKHMKTKTCMGTCQKSVTGSQRNDSEFLYTTELGILRK